MEYTLDFDKKQWDEIEALLTPFGIDMDFPPSLPRPIWMAVANMALGKAQRIELGQYGDETDDEGEYTWAADLREIARVILSEFRPGDGKI